MPSSGYFRPPEYATFALFAERKFILPYQLCCATRTSFARSFSISIHSIIVQSLRELPSTLELARPTCRIAVRWRARSYFNAASFSSRCRRAASSDSRRRGCVVDASSCMTRLRDSSRLSRSRWRWRSSGVRRAKVKRARRDSAVSFCSSTDLLSQPRAIISVCHKRPVLRSFLTMKN